MKKIGTLFVVILWAVLSIFAWISPAAETSEAERRPLAQIPALNADTVLDGSFMADFEDYTLDQFPLRDTFRKLKSLFHYNVLRQKDNNGIYIVDGYAAKLEYPLNGDSIDYAVRKFTSIYEKYLSGSKVWFAVAPDKGYYLAEANGYPAMDYAELFSRLGEALPWAEFVDLTDCLTAEDYYRTDTHWRQERLLPAARKLCRAMGVTAPNAEDFTQTLLDRPFYGVYCGQAALPMDPEELYILESGLLADCTVYNHETGETTAVYDPAALENKDLYDIFLSGSQSLLTIENPNGTPGKELIVFRDSFGSSLVPLILQDYATVTVVDIRYLASGRLDQFIDFHGQDVLFLYSTLVLNNSTTLK